MEKFQHAVDRSAIPTVTILGVEIADINMPWLLPRRRPSYHSRPQTRRHSDCPHNGAGLYGGDL